MRRGRNHGRGHDSISHSKEQWRFATALVFIVPLGVLTKFYTGAGSSWVGGHAGGLFYVVFWIFLALALFPRLSSVGTSLVVFAITCAVEFLQLWHPPLLTAVRRTFLGQTLLGNTFSWLDFPDYAAGCLLGYAAARAIKAGSPA
ncbi:MAG: DUF2809 domain-containing protein [Myxococcota bacterium]